MSFTEEYIAVDLPGTPKYENNKDNKLEVNVKTKLIEPVEFETSYCCWNFFCIKLKDLFCSC